MSNPEADIHPHVDLRVGLATDDPTPELGELRCV